MVADMTNTELAERIGRATGRPGYHPSNISNWLDGKVGEETKRFLAAALITGVHLDDHLYGKSMLDEVRASRAETQALREQVETLAGQVRQLLGPEAPSNPATLP